MYLEVGLLPVLCRVKWSQLITHKSTLALKHKYTLKKQDKILEELIRANARKTWRKSFPDRKLCYRIWVATAEKKKRLENTPGIFFFFCIMELSLKSIKVCFKVALSEMQTSCFHQCTPSVSATRKQPLPSLISPTKKCKIWGFFFFAVSLVTMKCPEAWMPWIGFVDAKDLFPCKLLNQVQPLSCGVIQAGVSPYSPSFSVTYVEVPTNYSTASFAVHLKKYILFCILCGLSQCFFSWAVPLQNFTHSQLSTSHSCR